MTQPMFVLVQFKVKDFPTYFEEYGAFMKAVVERFGGQFLAATREVVVKEGEPSGNFTAIIRFPSAEAAVKMYDSPEYAPLKRKRIEELTDGSSLVFIPGIETAD